MIQTWEELFKCRPTRRSCQRCDQPGLLAFPSTSDGHLWISIISNGVLIASPSVCLQSVGSEISGSEKNAEKQLLGRNGLRFAFQIKNAQMIILSNRNHILSSQPARSKNPEELRQHELAGIPQITRANKEVGDIRHHGDDSKSHQIQIKI